MTKQLRPLLLALLTLPLFVACDRHEEDKEVGPSKTELLTAHPWQGDKVLMMGIDVTQTGAIPPDAPDVRTLRLTFHEDNTYIAESEGLTFDGDWRFNEDETKIYFDFLGLSEADVNELTEENLHLGTSVSKGQVELLADLLNVDLGPIRNLPDGTPIKVEIRLVKP
ncbi:hypothetical protein [Pontibacter russatus]|uniref:hypothetical protein n=1 Tax=Pontibacter russatus TaxID=2694929 RepID=UPI001379CDEF|nr:hypothetical protein [Pontibacter russatus]